MISILIHSFLAVSGLSGSTETAQSQVSVGMGLLAGSTVMLLSVIWGTCIFVGKCDPQDSIALDGTDTMAFSLTGMSLDFLTHLFFFICTKIMYSWSKTVIMNFYIWMYGFLNLILYSWKVKNLDWTLYQNDGLCMNFVLLMTEYLWEGVP